MIIVASHRRSGTHWTIDSLRHNCVGVEKSFVNLDRILPWHNKVLSESEISKMMKDNTLVKTHTPATLSPFTAGGVYGFAERLINSSPRVYVVRDGRDVMVSLYHYMFGMGIDVPPFSDFLRQDNEFDVDKMNRVKYWAHHVLSWIRCADVVLQYEALHGNYEYAVRAVSSVLGLQVRDKIVSIDLLGRRSSAVSPRHGKVGEWEDYFSVEDLEFFHDNAGKAMEKLGY